MTAVSPTMAQSEIREARELAARARASAIAITSIESHELEVPGFAENPTHRCALCKTELMDVAAPIAERARRRAGRARHERRRPRRRASRHRGRPRARREHADGRRRPDEAGDPRAVASELGLPTWDKPQLACLSSRFPYGTQITPDRLRRVDEFEDGLRDARLPPAARALPRHDRAPRDRRRRYARASSSVREQIVALGKQLGFAYVALDLAGFRSGSMNEVLVPLKRAR